MKDFDELARLMDRAALDSQKALATMATAFQAWQESMGPPSGVTPDQIDAPDNRGLLTCEDPPMPWWMGLALLVGMLGLWLTLVAGAWVVDTLLGRGWLALLALVALVLVLVGVAWWTGRS